MLGCAEADVRAIGCEKPIAAVLSDADRMVEACRERGIKLAAGDLDRNFPEYWQARKMIEDGAIGDVVTINMLKGGITEMSGGGCQLFSLVRMFAFDADAAWVIGWVGGDPWSDHDQAVGGYIRFENGIECHMHLDTNARSGIEVLGTGGVFYCDGSYLEMWTAKEGANRPTMSDLTKVEGVFPTTSLWEGSGSYDEEGWRFPRPAQHSDRPVHDRRAGQRHGAYREAARTASRCWSSPSRCASPTGATTCRCEAAAGGPQPEGLPARGALAEQEGGLWGGVVRRGHRGSDTRRRGARSYFKSCIC